ncbi:hypothetical protein KSP35_02740 [Aquihabitans sp. G128]|uniref:hypothetical protein n=1 Tax=Aquihabitans sp. G128 TaxID=2849779 RepID=UPI001C21A731|nr:hypothetical protein [Aquihabitans sp. G128]QXC61775.1 hypothetical protein KSP35_02740 [Aquihabitans sp. G128]
MPGPLRFFGPALAGQVTWLFPLVLVGAAATTWAARRSARALAPVALWAGWLALYGVVFSTAQGIFHAYYSSVMVPAIAALVGMGVAAGRTLAAATRARAARPTGVLVAVGVALTATAAWQLVVTGRTPGFYDWTRPILVVLVGAGVVACVGAAAFGAVRHPRLVVAGLVVGLAGTLVAPTAWAVSGLGHRSHNATLPQAGPRIGTSGLSFGSQGSDGAADLAAYLRGRNQGETWDLATDNAQQASGLIAYDRLSVMALGGFNGHDPATDVAKVADLVAERRLRFFAVAPDPIAALTAFFHRAVHVRFAANAPAGSHATSATVAVPASLALVARLHGSRPLVPSSPAARVLDSVAEVCRPVRLPASVGPTTARIGTLYDCRGRAPALRRSARQWERGRSGR